MQKQTSGELRIGLMGGTFDPIHIGHVVTAEFAREEFALDKVIFIPSCNPPHKHLRKVTDAAKRMEMVQLATITNYSFEISDVELVRGGFSYTYDTVCYFRELYGEETKLYFITGADAIMEILTWKNVDKLIKACEFIAATRPGYYLDIVKVLPRDYWDQIHFMEIPALSISSTDIRARVHAGKSVKYLLPESVETYIKKNKLYLDGDRSNDGALLRK